MSAVDCFLKKEKGKNGQELGMEKIEIKGERRHLMVW